MREKAGNALESIKQFWGGMSRKMRIAILSVAAGVVLVSLVVVVMLHRPQEDVVLFADLTTAESSRVWGVISELNVNATMDKNGAIRIPAQDEARVRMQLATQSYPDDSFGYSIFEKGSSLTATQLEKNQYKLFQLQDRLEATIETFAEIKRAVVTISIPEKNAFVLQDETPAPSASVKLEKKPGRTLSQEQIYGIINIVKNSVPGLLEENISVADETGDLKIQAQTSDNNYLSKLHLTEQVNETVRNRVLSFIQPAFGEGRVTVAVNSILNTDSQVTEKNTYVPVDEEEPANNPLSRVERRREGAGLGEVAQGIPGAEDNTDVPLYAGQDDTVDNGDYYTSHDVLDYLVSNVRDQIVKEGFEISDLSVAVMVDAALVADGQRDQIIDLVATAAGVTRDRVSVQPIRFVSNEPSGISIIPENNTQRLLLLSGLAFLVLFLLMILLFVVLSRRSKRKLAAALAQQQAALDYEEEFEEDYEDSEEEESPEEVAQSLLDLMNSRGETPITPLVLEETNEQKLKAQIKDLASSDPGIVAQLIRTWLSE